MTKQKDLKRRIRQRMRKTGESYTTARLHILRNQAAGRPAGSAAPDPLIAGDTGAVFRASPIRISLPRVLPPAVLPSRLAYTLPLFTILLFIVVALTGCASGTEGSSVAVSDSAGVQIVENLNGSIEAAGEWALSVNPLVEIGGGVGPETPLFHITSIEPLEGGRVAVGTNTPPQVHVFEEDGRLGGTLGRRGQGPGEFASVASVVSIARDSLAVWDADRRRISVFDPGGRYVRELDVGEVAPLSARAAPSISFASGFTHLLPSGDQAFIIFGEGALEPAAAPGIGRPALPAVRISTAGDLLAELDPMPGMEMFYGGPAGALPLPFGARTSAGTWGERLIVGTGDLTEFRVFGGDGRLVRIVRWPDHDRTVSGEWLNEWAGMVEAAPPPIRKLAQETPRRERFPAHDGLVTSEGGEVLVGEYAGPMGIWPLRRADEGPEALRPARRPRERRWLVFDPDGVLTATLRTPEGFAPATVRQGRLWGVFTDTLDIESVRAYRILR